VAPTVSTVSSLPSSSSTPSKPQVVKQAALTTFLVPKSIPTKPSAEQPGPKSNSQVPQREHAPSGAPVASRQGRRPSIPPSIPPSSHTPSIKQGSASAAVPGLRGAHTVAKGRAFQRTMFSAKPAAPQAVPISSGLAIRTRTPEVPAARTNQPSRSNPPVSTMGQRIKAFREDPTWRQMVRDTLRPCNVRPTGIRSTEVPQRDVVPSVAPPVRHTTTTINAFSTDRASQRTGMLSAKPTAQVYQDNSVQVNEEKNAERHQQMTSCLSEKYYPPELREAQRNNQRQGHAFLWASEVAKRKRIEYDRQMEEEEKQEAQELRWIYDPPPHIQEYVDAQKRAEALSKRRRLEIRTTDPPDAINSVTKKHPHQHGDDVEAMDAEDTR